MNNPFDWMQTEYIKVFSKFGPEYMPKRSNRDDAGIDLRTPVDINLPPGGSMVIDTGLVIDTTDFDYPLWIQILPRSGAGFKYGLEFMNTVGVIDRSYRGKNDSIKLALSRKSVQPVVGVFDDYASAYKFVESEYNWGAEWLGIENYNDAVYVMDETPVKTRLYKSGERFAQMIIMPYAPVGIKGISIEQLTDDNRGGIHSTGKK